MCYKDSLDVGGGEKTLLQSVESTGRFTAIKATYDSLILTCGNYHDNRGNPGVSHLSKVCGTSIPL